MNEFLYYVIKENDKHYFYKFEDAKKYFDVNGGRMYAYTKNLFPTKALLYC